MTAVEMRLGCSVRAAFLTPQPPQSYHSEERKLHGRIGWRNSRNVQRSWSSMKAWLARKPKTLQPTRFRHCLQSRSEALPEISEAEVEQQLRDAANVKKRTVDIACSAHDALDGDLIMPIGTQFPTKVLSWLDGLEADDAALVRARLEGARWKLICWRFGISRATAHRRWHRSLRSMARRVQEDPGSN